MQQWQQPYDGATTGGGYVAASLHSGVTNNMPSMQTWFPTYIGLC